MTIEQFENLTEQEIEQMTQEDINLHIQSKGDEKYDVLEINRNGSNL